LICDTIDCMKIKKSIENGNTPNHIIYTLKYIKICYEYIQIHLSMLEYIRNTLKYIFILILICIKAPSKYIAIPSKNLKYLISYIIVYNEIVLKPHYSSLLCLIT
jgi:hypothetical protein